MLATVRHWLGHRLRSGRSPAAARPPAAMSPVPSRKQAQQGELGEGDILSPSVAVFTIQQPKHQHSVANCVIETNVNIEQQQQHANLPRVSFWRRLVGGKRRHRAGHNNNNHNNKDKQHQSTNSVLTKLVRVVCCCCCCCHSVDHPDEWHPRTSTTTTTSADNTGCPSHHQQHQQPTQANDNINDVIINRLSPLDVVVVNNNNNNTNNLCDEGVQASLGLRERALTRTINHIDGTDAGGKTSTQLEGNSAAPPPPPTLDTSASSLVSIITTTTYHEPSTSNHVDEVTPPPLSTSSSSVHHQRPHLDLANFVNSKLNEPSSSSSTTTTSSGHIARSKIVPYLNDLHPKVSYLPWRRSTPSSAFVTQQLEVSSKRLMKEIGDIMRKQQQHEKELQMNRTTTTTTSSLPFSVELIEDSLYEWNIHIHRFDADSQIEADMREHNISSIVLQATFPQSYPFEPPFVRVVRPYIERGYVMEGGAICLELLTKTGWTSAYTMEAVIYQLMASLIKGQARIKPNKDASKCFTKKSAENSFRHIVRIHDKHGWVDTPLYEG